MAWVTLFECDGKLRVERQPHRYEGGGEGGALTLAAGDDRITIHYKDASCLASVLLTIAADLHQQVIQAPATSHAPAAEPREFDPPAASHSR